METLASQDKIVRAVILIAAAAAAAVAVVVVVPGIMHFNKNNSDCLIKMNLLYIIIFSCIFYSSYSPLRISHFIYNCIFLTV
jgi:peroxiredoxin family protein